MSRRWYKDKFDDETKRRVAARADAIIKIRLIMIESTYQDEAAMLAPDQVNESVILRIKDIIDDL